MDASFILKFSNSPLEFGNGIIIFDFFEISLRFGAVCNANFKLSMSRE